jgi:hypothetical protein
LTAGVGAGQCREVGAWPGTGRGRRRGVAEWGRIAPGPHKVPARDSATGVLGLPEVTVAGAAQRLNRASRTGQVLPDRGGAA